MLTYVLIGSALQSPARTDRQMIEADSARRCFQATEYLSREHELGQEFDWNVGPLCWAETGDPGPTSGMPTDMDFTLGRANVSRLNVHRL